MEEKYDHFEACRFTSTFVYKKAKLTSQEIFQLDCGANVLPFHDLDYDDRISSLPRGPYATCLSCGAYINSYVTIVDNSLWVCPFCKKQNRCESMQYANIPELHCQHYDCQEIIRDIDGTSSNVSTSKYFILALDADLCREDGYLDWMFETLSQVNPQTFISFLILDKNCLKLVRLGSHTLSPLGVDILPSSNPKIGPFKKNMSKGLYKAPLDFVLQNKTKLIQGILSLVSIYSPHSLQKFWIDSLIAFTESEENLIGHQSCHLIIFANKKLKLQHTSDHEESIQLVGSAQKVQSVGIYCGIGKRLMKKNCEVSIFFLSTGEGNFDQLERLASTSGGKFIHGESIHAHSVKVSWEKYLKYLNQPPLFSSAFATMEVRTSSELALDRMTGPIFEIHSQLDTPQSSLTTFDEDHVNQSIQNNSYESNENIQVLKKKLSSYCKQNVGYVGIFPSDGKDTCISLHLKANDVASTPSSSWFDSLFSFKSLQVDSSLPEKTPSSSTNKDLEENEINPGFIQIIIRYSAYPNNEKERNMNFGKFKFTRVWTFPIHFTESYPRYLDSLDTQLWSFIVLRGLVADYHDVLIEEYGGAKKVLFDDQGVDRFISIKKKFTNYLDKFLTDLALHPVNDSYLASKLRNIAEAVYYLREGKLLDGASAVNSQESFILRTYFLRFPLSVAYQLLVPRLRLDLALRLQSNKQQPQLLLDVPSESMFLLPGTVALLDGGSEIIIRINNYSNENTIPEALIHAEGRLITLAKQMAETRFPVAKIIVIQKPGSSDDRFIFSKLSPNHMDRVESLQLYLNDFLRKQDANLLSISEAEINIMAQNSPTTDQFFFVKYLSLVSPKFLNMIQNAEKAGPPNSIPVFDEKDPSHLPPPPHLPPPTHALSMDRDFQDPSTLTSISLSTDDNFSV